MPNFVLGKNCVAYYSTTAVTAGTNAAYASAISGATEVDNVKDLKLNFSTEKADISTRASGGWKNSVATVKDGTISTTMQWRPNDVAFTAFKNAWLNSTEIFFAALDGPEGTSGSSGPAGNFVISNFSRNEALNEAVSVDCELSPSSYSGWFVAT